MMVCWVRQQLVLTATAGATAGAPGGGTAAGAPGKGRMTPMGTGGTTGGTPAIMID